jgi:excisionase family DNA binding protein
MLGVDPDTLRRWADAGRVRSFSTPGGHRRFARTDLDRMREARRSGRRSLAALGATPERFTRAYARSYRTTPPVPRSGGIDAAARDAFRADGRRLVETLLDYLDAPDGPRKSELEEQATASVGLTARRLAASGTDPVVATGAFITARGPFLAALESLGRRRSLDAPALMGLYAEAAALLDRLLLHFVATFHRPAAED